MIDCEMSSAGQFYLELFERAALYERLQRPFKVCSLHCWLNKENRSSDLLNPFRLRCFLDEFKERANSIAASS